MRHIIARPEMDSERMKSRLDFMIQLEISELNRLSDIYARYKANYLETQIVDTMQSIRQLLYIRDNRLYLS